jgi:hypothetical protein
MLVLQEEGAFSCCIALHLVVVLPCRRRELLIHSQFLPGFFFFFFFLSYV